MLHFIKRNKLFIYSYLIVLAAFIFARLPLFIWSPIAGMGTDAFEYFFKAREFKYGLPVFDIIPIAYPFVIYILSSISNTLFALLFFQNFLCLLTSLFLTHTAAKYFPNKAIAIAVFISVYLLDGMHGSLDSMLLPDSIYISSLLFLSGCLIYAFKGNRLRYWFFLAFAIVLPALIRPNGLYTYFLIVFIIWFLNKNRKGLLVFTLFFLLANLLWASYNFFTGGVFMIGNYTRIVNVFSPEVKEHYVLVNKREDDKFKFAFALFGNFASVNNSFYYEMPYRKAYLDTMKMNYKQNDALVFDIDDDLKKYILKELYAGSASCEYIDMTKFNSKGVVANEKNKVKRYVLYFKNTNLWLFSYQIYIKAYSFIVKKYIIIIVWLLCYLISAYLFVRKKFRDKENLLAFAFGSMHFISLIFILLSHQYTMCYNRYAFVTEFYVYLTFVFMISKDRYLKIKGVLFNKFL